MCRASCTFVIALLASPRAVAGLRGETDAGLGLYLRVWNLKEPARCWESTKPAAEPPLEWLDLRGPGVDDPLMRQLSRDLDRVLRAEGAPGRSGESPTNAIVLPAPWSVVEEQCFRLGIAEALFDLALDAGSDLVHLRGWDGLVAAAAHPGAAPTPG